MKRHSCLSQPFRDSSEAMAALLRPLVILLLADELHGSGTSARHSEEAEDLDGEGKEDEVRPAHEL